jgi:hypothetical protein
MYHRTAFALWSTFVMLVPLSAKAEDGPPFPQDKICDGDIVHKTKLAQYLLQKNPVNVVAVSPTNNPLYAGLDLPRRILVDSTICREKDTLCSKVDRDNLDNARGSALTLLTGYIKGYQPSRPVEPEVFFLGDNRENVVNCLKQNGSPVQTPSSAFNPPTKTAPPVRLRGKANDLFVDRSTASKSEFQATSQATINFTNDSIAHKGSQTFQGALGYSFAMPLSGIPGQKLEIIPYAQINSSGVRTGIGKTLKRTSSDTYSFGIMGTGFFITESATGVMGHILNFRPDVLVDTENDTQILAANVQYIPVIRSALNSFVRVVPNVDNLASFKLLLDFRWTGGTYLDRGIPSAVAQSVDYWRFGGRGGIVVVSDNDNVPLSFTSSFILLEGLSGGVDINYLENTLSLALDKDKLFGLSASYVNGKREDTAKGEQMWKLGLTGRF